MQRWDLEEYYAPEAAGGLTMSVRLGAFVPGLDGFDAALFRCVRCTSRASTCRAKGMFMRNNGTCRRQSGQESVFDGRASMSGSGGQGKLAPHDSATYACDIAITSCLQESLTFCGGAG